MRFVYLVAWTILALVVLVMLLIDGAWESVVTTLFAWIGGIISNRLYDTWWRERHGVRS